MKRFVDRIAAYLALAAVAGPLNAAGLAPCEYRPPADVVVEYWTTAQWTYGRNGARIRRDGDAFLLYAYFDTWSAPAYVRYEIGRHVPISPNVALRVQALVDAERRRADPANASMWFDPPTYHSFATTDGCADIDELSVDARDLRLIGVFELLAIQALVPSRALGYCVEQLVLARVNVLEGKPMSELSLMLAGALLLFVACAAVPFFIAAPFAALPRPLPAGRRFILTAGTFAWGATCVVAVFVVLPAVLVAFHNLLDRPDLDDTHAFVAEAILANVWTVLFVMWIGFSVHAPLRLRRVWPRIVGGSA